jgi:hypothetical protein
MKNPSRHFWFHPRRATDGHRHHNEINKLEGEEAGLQALQIPLLLHVFIHTASKEFYVLKK